MNLEDLTLFRRACVICPEVPTCPACAADEICQLTTQSCNSCPQTYCQKVSVSPTNATPIPTSTFTSTSSSSSSLSIGPIIGGVVGGLIAILVAVFLVWWFYVRPRRNNNIRLSTATTNTTITTRDGTNSAYEKNGLSGIFYSAGDQNSHYLDNGPIEPHHQQHIPIVSRSSSNLQPPLFNNRETTISVSTTSLNRSSNIIPVAYIPGVTTRANLDSLNTNTLYGGRMSIASNDYRASTAVISAATMTAIQAHPNLVDIEHSDNDADELGSDIRTSILSDIKSTIYSSPPTLQRMNLTNARSVTIGNGSSNNTNNNTNNTNNAAANNATVTSPPVRGLQNLYIPEEDESSMLSSSDGDDDEDEIAGIGSNGFPKGLQMGSDYNNTGMHFSKSNSASSLSHSVSYPGNNRHDMISSPLANQVVNASPGTSKHLAGNTPTSATTADHSESGRSTLMNTSTVLTTPQTPIFVKVNDEDSNVYNTPETGEPNITVLPVSDSVNSFESELQTNNNNHDNFSNFNSPTYQPELLVFSENEPSKNPANQLSQDFVYIENRQLQFQQAQSSKNSVPSNTHLLHKDLAKSMITPSASADQIIADLPIEALLYSQSDNDLNADSSP